MIQPPPAMSTVTRPAFRPVLIGHGSPDPASCRELAELGLALAGRLDREVDLGVLEFAGPHLRSIEEVLDVHCRSGHACLALQPLLLFDGLHGRTDLPQLAERARRRGAEVRLGTPFGEDPALVALAAARLWEMQPQPGDRLLFVGRGSSYPAALSQTARVAEEVARRAGLDHGVCYTGISHPDLGEGAAAALRERPRRLLVLPYLLHAGVLLRRVRDVIGPAAARAGIPAVVLPHIGNHSVLTEILGRRLRGLLEVSEPVRP